MNLTSWTKAATSSPVGITRRKLRRPVSVTTIIVPQKTIRAMSPSPASRWIATVPTLPPINTSSHQSSSLNMMA